MNKGVEILLARMDTHPEEFEQDGKWVNMYNEYKKFMEPEEQQMMMDKLKQLKMNKFEELVVTRLMREEKENDPTMPSFEPRQKDLFGNNGSPYDVMTINTSDRFLWNDEEEQIEEIKRTFVEKLAKVNR